MGPFDCFKAMLSDSADIFSFMVLHNLADQWIIRFHFSKKNQTKLTQSLFYKWKTCILVQDFQTDIPRQAESDTDGLILYLLKDLKGGVWEMHIRNTAIFKDGPYVYFIES